MSLSIEELMKLPMDDKEEYIKGGILGLGQVMLIAAPAASLKSVVGLNIAHALGKGDKVFGQFETGGPTKVALFDKEIGRYYLQKRLRLFYARDPAPPRNVRFSAPEDEESNFFLDQSSSLDPIRKELDRAQPQVAILDCLNPMLLGEESGETYAMVARNVAKLQQEYGGYMGIVLLHHMVKLSSDSDPLAMTNVRGHGKLVDWAATRVMLHRKTKFKAAPGLIARLSSRWVLRHGPEIPKLDLSVMSNLRIESTAAGLMDL